MILILALIGSTCSVTSGTDPCAVVDNNVCSDQTDGGSGTCGCTTAYVSAANLIECTGNNS